MNLETAAETKKEKEEKKPAVAANEGNQFQFSFLAFPKMPKPMSRPKGKTRPIAVGLVLQNLFWYPLSCAEGYLSLVKTHHNFDGFYMVFGWPIGTICQCSTE